MNKLDIKIKQIFPDESVYKIPKRYSVFICEVSNRLANLSESISPRIEVTATRRRTESNTDSSIKRTPALFLDSNATNAAASVAATCGKDIDHMFSISLRL